MEDVTNCGICTREISEDEVEPACEECGLDGCCADCMAEHVCVDEPV